jgi:hypothetical protein
MPINDQHGVYTSKSSVLEFLWALSKHFKSILHENASTSHVYSILVDESIDPSMKQHLIVHFCYLGFQGGLSNDIFFGGVGYQGCHMKKYVYCLFFIGEIRLGFIKIGSPCYQLGNLYDRMQSKVVNSIIRKSSNIGKHTLCNSLGRFCNR